MTVTCFAIDATTGGSLWDVAIADQKKGERVPMAPIAWNDMIFVGNAAGKNRYQHAIDRNAIDA